MSDVPVPSDPPPDRAVFRRATLADLAQTVRTFRRARDLHDKRFYTRRRHLGLSPAARPAPPASDAALARGFVPVRVVYDATPSPAR